MDIRRSRRSVALAMALTLGIMATSSISIAAAEIESNAYFHSENADEVNIQDTGIYTLVLKANEGWSFTVTDGTDVTSWLVNESGGSVIVDTKGVAVARNIEKEVSEGNTLEVDIDASKITGFTSGGANDIYITPPSDSMWVAGDNKGFYNVSTCRVGKYTIPTLEVSGQIYGIRGSNGIEFTNDTVTIALRIDGVDDSLIDSSAASIKIVDGDGYYVSDFVFSTATIDSDWQNGKNTYTISPDDISFNSYGYESVSGGRGWSEQGGDGNGHYYIYLGISGITYNGLPVFDARFPIHIYIYGRTFTVEGGSVIASSQPKWSTAAENNLPVLCDEYPDDLNITWPIGFDASALTASDITVTLHSDYGDELALVAGRDFTLSTGNSYSTITVNYIYWAFAPVYTTLSVEVNTDNLSWNEEMYQVSTISHTYDIASVYAYYVLGGGLTGTLIWSFYGIEGMEEWNQLFSTVTYRLSYTDADGNKRYYTEDASGNAYLVNAEQDATSFDASADFRTEVRGNVAFCTRMENITEDKTVNSTTITFDKEYDNPEYNLLSPTAATGITVRRGYILNESSWEAHGRWPWQIFVNEGYQGGTK